MGTNAQRGNGPRDSGPLRVLCCSGSLEGGGSERQLWQLATKLDRVEFSPSVYLLYRRGHYIEQLPHDVSVTAFWDSFNESKRYWPGQIRKLQIEHLANVLREHRIDVVYDRTFHMTLVTAPAARRVGVPRVSVIVSPPSADFQKSRERFRLLKKHLLARAYRQPGCVTIAVSDEVADDAARFYGLDRDRLVTIQNPVDVEAVKKLAIGDKSTNADSVRVAARSVPRIAVVGRLSREKGQRFAIQALKRLVVDLNMQVELDIVGDGPDRAELEQLASELGVRQQIHFHGFLANPYPVIVAAAAVCIPSEHEGLPNVALETMVLGRPLVASDCSGALRELVGQSERGTLVSPANASVLADAIRSVFEEPGLWVRRCAAAQAWVTDKHSLNPWLERMNEILRGAAAVRHL